MASLDYFRAAGLALVPRKIAGPTIAVVPNSLVRSRCRHKLLEEFVNLIVWRGTYAPILGIAGFYRSFVLVQSSRGE